MDDSGSDSVVIYFGDIMLLRDMEATATGLAQTLYPPLVGVSRSILSDGSVAMFFVRMVEAAIFADHNGGRMTDQGSAWDLVPCVTRDGYQTNLADERIAGLWPRFKLYTGSAPDKTGRLYLTDVKSGLNRYVPNAGNDHNMRVQPPFIIPIQVVRLRLYRLRQAQLECFHCPYLPQEDRVFQLCPHSFSMEGGMGHNMGVT